MSWLKQGCMMFPTGKETVALELLQGKREMYGLEMVKASAGALGRGTIYVILDRLQEKGFVASRTEKVTGTPGMPRRLYCITGLGQRALTAMQSAQAIMIGDPIAVGGQ